MPALNVPVIQLVGLVIVYVTGLDHPQVLVPVPNSVLTPGAGESVDPHPRRHAGVATAAMRPVQVVAAASKAHDGQLRVEIDGNRLTRINEEGGGLLFSQVTAGMGKSCIDADISKGSGHLPSPPNNS